MIKENIIRASIESLRQEGLKFSVDTLAEKLKISKKTVYKYFPDKEALALAVFERYYADAATKAKTLIHAGPLSVNSDLLHLYFDSKIMTRSDIFNKYKLNEAISSYVREKNDDLWNTISAFWRAESLEQDMEALRTIIDGAFEKLCNDRKSPDAVIERLVQLL